MVLPWALPHRNQKEDVKPLEPLFSQAEWISFPSLASALRTSRGQWDGLTPHGQSPGARTHDPVVYLLSLHSAPSFPARSHSGRTAPTASGGVRQRWAIPAPYTHPGHTGEQALRQTGHSQRSLEEQRAELHKAQVSLSLAPSGHIAQAGPGSLEAAGIRAGRAWLLLPPAPATVHRHSPHLRAE